LARRGFTVRLSDRRPDPRAGAPERGRSINLALAARGITFDAETIRAEIEAAVLELKKGLLDE
jgi:hypothetical protein